MSQYLFYIKRHTNETKCKGAEHVCVNVVVQAPHTQTQGDVPRTLVKPGPKPFDVERHLMGRQPAFDDDAFDARIEYLFETPGLIDACLTTLANKTVHGQLVEFFKRVWGKQAPVEFQSIVTFNGKVYEIEALDEGTVTLEEYPTVRKYLNERFLEEYLACIVSICRDSIPIRRPDLVAYANDILRVISMSHNGLCIEDVYQKNEAYESYRLKAKKVVTAANTIRSTLINIITMQTIKS